MNKPLIKKFILAVIICIHIYGCDNEFELNDVGRITPVVYSLINPDDSIHFVRVGKTFLGSQDFHKISNEQDSLYFNDVKVSLDIYTKDGFILHSFLFEETICMDKEAGFFSSNPYVIYRLNKKLSPYLGGNFYGILSVAILDTDQLVSCKLDYHQKPEILSPQQGVVTYLSLYSKNPLEVTWTDRSAFKNYTLNVYFIYESIRGSISEPDTAIITYKKSSQTTAEDFYHPRLTIGIYGESFFPKLKSSIYDDESVDYRLFKKIYFEIVTSNPEFMDYVTFLNIANYGNVENYTNIIGGLGIVTFVYSIQSSPYILDMQSKDSLVKGRFTSDLRFSYW